MSAQVPTAREVAHGIAGCADDWVYLSAETPKRHRSICDRMTAAIERDRAATIEACAREADMQCVACRKVPDDFGRMYHESCREARAAAKRIRALDTRKAP
jgi:hypothetical protein